MAKHIGAVMYVTSLKKASVIHFTTVNLSAFRLLTSAKVSLALKLYREAKRLLNMYNVHLIRSKSSCIKLHYITIKKVTKF